MAEEEKSKIYKIEIAGMEEKGKEYDFKLKLIKSYGSFMLVAIDKDGIETSLVEIRDDGYVARCHDELSEID
jgi:hypothetical protein